MQILGIAVLSALYYNKRYVILISHYSVLSSTNEFRKHYKCLIINIFDKQNVFRNKFQFRIFWIQQNWKIQIYIETKVTYKQLNEI